MAESGDTKATLTEQAKGKRVIQAAQRPTDNNNTVLCSRERQAVLHRCQVAFETSTSAHRRRAHHERNPGGTLTWPPPKMIEPVRKNTAAQCSSLASS